MQAGYLDKNGRLMTDIDFNELTGVLYDILKGQPDIDKKVRFVVQVLYQAEYPSSIGFFRSLNTNPYACEYNLKRYVLPQERFITLVPVYFPVVLTNCCHSKVN
jgi:hypothetical protein